MKVYFVSGLGADSRVFKYIRLPANCEMVYLGWIEPLHNESLQNYALRLAEKIDTSKPFAIIGLSMGGMIASEIAQKLKPAVTILISSIPSSKHLPFYFRMVGKLKIHKAIPMSLLKSGAGIKHFFSIRAKDDKSIIHQMLKDADDQFMRWAMDAILKWKSESMPSHYIHIHGTYEETLPVRFTKPTHSIKKAGHLMVITNAKAVNKILEDELSKFKD